MATIDKSVNIMYHLFNLNTIFMGVENNNNVQWISPEEIAKASAAIDARKVADMEAVGNRGDKVEAQRALVNGAVSDLQRAQNFVQIAVVFAKLSNKGVEKFGDERIEDLVAGMGEWQADADGAIGRLDDDSLKRMLEMKLPLFGGLREKVFSILRPQSAPNTPETMADRLSDRRERLDRLDAMEQPRGTIQGPGSLPSSENKAA